MARLAELRNVLWDAAAELTSPAHSLVLTNYLPPGRPPTVLDRHRELAQQLGLPLVAVVLQCDPEEVIKRIPNPDRAARMKLVDPDGLVTLMSSTLVLPDWPELVDLDITGLSPAEAASPSDCTGGRARRLRSSDTPDAETAGSDGGDRLVRVSRTYRSGRASRGHDRHSGTVAGNHRACTRTSNEGEKVDGTVRPSHELLIEPSKRHADVMVPHGGTNAARLDVLRARVQELLYAADAPRPVRAGRVVGPT